MPWKNVNYPQSYKYLPGKLKKAVEIANIIDENNDEKLADFKHTREYFENRQKSKIHRYFTSYNN